MFYMCELQKYNNKYSIQKCGKVFQHNRQELYRKFELLTRVLHKVIGLKHL